MKRMFRLLGTHKPGANEGNDIR